MADIISFKEASKQLSLKEKVGQLFMPASFINDTETEIQQLENLIREQHIGALCFFHSRASAATNFESNKKVQANEHSFTTLQTLIQRYQKAAKYPLLIAIDAEWGLAMRVENTPQYPYAITLGAQKNNADLVYQVGKQIAQDCKVAGIHWNLAPVVDINNNPRNPVIGYRSFGDNKQLVLSKAEAFIKGTESEGVLTSIKHFPGHGDTATDSHLGLPIITKTKASLLENELYPFQQLINKGVDSVMVGHLSVPSLTAHAKIPSSINKDIITGLLRNEMGFKGVVISDALNMHAVSKNYTKKGQLEWLAFNAGNDILCFSENTKEGIEMILSHASVAQIEKSLERIWSLKEKAFRQEASQKNLSNPDMLNSKIAEKTITLRKGTAKDIAVFRKRDYCTLTFKRDPKQTSTSALQKALSEMKDQVRAEKDILLLLTPPRVKPAANFGFLAEEIDFINGLFHTKNVVLYLFGNPYVLERLNISQSLATVIVYQNFKVFEAIATEHFLGTLEATGELPYTLL